MCQTSGDWEKGAPPITPYVENRLPLGSVTKAGMMVWKGRLFGPRQLGWLASRMKLCPRFWSVNPQPSGTIPAPSAFFAEEQTCGFPELDMWTADQLLYMLMVFVISYTQKRCITNVKQLDSVLHLSSFHT